MKQQEQNQKTQTQEKIPGQQQQDQHSNNPAKKQEDFSSTQRQPKQDK